MKILQNGRSTWLANMTQSDIPVILVKHTRHHSGFSWLLLYIWFPETYKVNRSSRLKLQSVVLAVSMLHSGRVINVQCLVICVNNQWFVISEAGVQSSHEPLKCVLITFSRNSAVFYWKSANLIGSPAVFYSPIENSRARVHPRPVVFLNFWLWDP